MQALILAAGLGNRLGTLTRNTPKSLLDLGNGYTVLETQLFALRKVGIKDVVIVTGYLSDQIEAKVKFLNNWNIVIVYNPFYRITNNLVSFWLGLPYMRGDFVSINGDNVFSPLLLERLLDSRGNIVMTIDRKDAYDADDMKVITHDSLVTTVGKHIPPQEANAESVGIIKYCGTGTSLIRQAISNMIKRDENMSAFYLSALQQIINEGFPVTYCEVEPDLWAEVDFHEDLQYLRKIIINKTKRVVSWLQ